MDISNLGVIIDTKSLFFVPSTYLRDLKTKVSALYLIPYLSESDLPSKL